MLFVSWPVFCELKDLVCPFSLRHKIIVLCALKEVLIWHLQPNAIRHIDKPNILL